MSKKIKNKKINPVIMAFAPCSADLSANIDVDCTNPRIVGYEDTAIIVNRNNIDWTAITYDANNSNIVTALALSTGSKWSVIYNPRTNPAHFAGTNTTLSTDTGRYTKTLQFYYEGIGGDASADVVEPLKNGDYVAILQRKDHRGHGSFQIMGLQGGLRASAQVQDEETGYWLITMTCDEPSGEMEYFATDYATSKTNYDAFVANSF